MHLVFDFDGTVTERDTIAELVHAALDSQQSRHGRDLSSTWSNIVQQYADDYQSYKAAYPVQESERSSLQDELKYLAGMSGIEEASLARVESSGVFAGLAASDLFDMGADAVERGRIRKREGFNEIVEFAGQRGWTVGIISVNWSRSFIDGVIHPRKIQVIANEISVDGGIDGPEFLGRKLTTSTAKKEAYDHVVRGDAQKTIYFGDSATDLECLLPGGIVMAQDETSSLMKTLHRVGMEVPHVSHASQPANIHWARNFREVLHSGILET